MFSNQIPPKFPIPFANSPQPGLSNPIPVNSQIGIVPGAASLQDGFPPTTFLLIGAGGVPPWGRDFNGLLNQTTAWSRWEAAGAPTPWDAAFSTAIGGYPLGALIASATTINLWWLSLVENNTSNPDTGGANWYPCTFAPPIVSSTRNLIGSAPGRTPTASWTVTEIIAKNKVGQATFLGSNLAFNFNGSSVGANGMDTGALPTSTTPDLNIYAIYNPTGPGWSTLGTVACNGETYTGVNLPVGYTTANTASALLWSGKCGGTYSPGVLTFSQFNRKVWLDSQITGSSADPQAIYPPYQFRLFGNPTPTFLSLSGAVPANAHTVRGQINVEGLTSITWLGVSLSFLPLDADGRLKCHGPAVLIKESGLVAATADDWELPCIGQQIAYYVISPSNSTGLIIVNGYEF